MARSAWITGICSTCGSTFSREKRIDIINADMCGRCSLVQSGRDRARKEAEAEIEAVRQKLDAMVADENLMPWEKKARKSS